MKTTETLKTLAATRRNAIDTASILDTIAKQETHPTLQLERRQAADRLKHFARGIQMAIFEIHEMHTDRATELIRRFKFLASKFEKNGYDERLEGRLDIAANYIGKATGFRYAAQLVADENVIDVDFDTIYYNTPLQEGGEA